MLCTYIMAVGLCAVVSGYHHTRSMSTCMYIPASLVHSVISDLATQIEACSIVSLNKYMY